MSTVATLDVLEEAAAVLIRRWKIEGKPRVCASEPAMKVAVTHRFFAPLVDVNEWVPEVAIYSLPLGPGYLISWLKNERSTGRPEQMRRRVIRGDR